MLQVGIAELKARLSEYLARVSDGEEIVVEDRGRPVARLLPPLHVSGADEYARLIQLQRRGLVHVGSGKLPDSVWNRERSEDDQAQVRAALEADRAEGF